VDCSGCWKTAAYLYPSLLPGTTHDLRNLSLLIVIQDRDELLGHVLGHVDRNSSCAREISHSLEGRCVVLLIFER
jgi:hypothetical protein